MAGFMFYIHVFVVIHIISQVLSIPVIQSVGETTSAALGTTAEFECQVSGLEANQQVVWKFVDHNITISSATEIHVSQGLNTKYEIFRPQDANTFFNLRVYKIDSGDMGTYKCYISGMEDTVNVVYHLAITDAPARPEPTGLNVTSCCRARGVNCSLALCDTSSSQADYLSLLSNPNCIDDELLDVIICGQGGRNHMGCCMRSGVSSNCLILCGGVYVEGDYNSCLLQAFTIQSCFIQGTAWYPSPPVSVSASVVGNQVMISWQPPLENSDKVTGYKVKYREFGTEHFKSTDILSAKVTFYQMIDLKKDTMYEFSVVALAVSGSSQPSYSIDVVTKADIPDVNSINRTIAECCQSKGIQGGCLNYCQADSYRAEIHPDLYARCFGDIKDIFQCLTGQGNHTPCCERMNVPDTCWMLCEGQMPMEWNVIQCFQYLPIISTCMLENSALLPLPPRNTHVVPNSVTSDSVTIGWESPQDNSIMSYTVAWRYHDDTKAQWNVASVISGTEHRITNLRSATIYDVVVSSVNDNGSSLPELTLVVVTEGISNVVEKPYNETECCTKKGVASDCLNICDHKFRLSDQVLTEGLRCYEGITPMLACASDLRNHTECCIRRNVPAECLGICAFTDRNEDLVAFIGCVGHIQAISTCMDEGKTILPRPPERFTVMHVEETMMTLDWHKPMGPAVTMYSVRYWEYRGISSWTVINTTETFVSITKLKPNTVYMSEAVSINGNGTSVPSVIQRVATLRVPTGTPIDWTQVWQNRSACCAGNGVSDVCQPTCKGEAFDRTQCGDDMDKIIACAADGRDHSQCCTRFPGFPKTCLPYCQGLTPDRTVQNALCMAHVDIMYTCFSEGEGLLPTPPQSLTVDNYTSTSITIVWDTPSSNCEIDSCSYVALIWPGSFPSLVKKMKVPYPLTNYTFKNLDPVRQYHMSVTAHNKKGDSLLASIVSVLTKSSESEVVIVTQSPGGIIDNGDYVQLECRALGSQRVLTSKWMYGTLVKSRMNLLSITDVTSDMAGKYTCEVQIYGVSGIRNESKSLILNVRSKPRPKGFVAENVLPGIGKDADLSCWFLGFPEVITWTKNQQSIQGVNKYLIQPLKVDLTTGNTTSILRVQSVEKSDYGTYGCSGTNKFGTQVISGEFKYEYPKDDTLPTKPPGSNPEVCCRKLGVQEKCIPKVCTFAIDIEAIAMDTSLQDCLMDLDKFLVCAADGRDHTSCCKSKGVTNYCLPFCAGQAPSFDDSWELFQCAMFDEEILGCVQDGQKFIPTAPQNLMAEQQYNLINVHWDPPQKNPDKVTTYDIYYTVDSETSYGSVGKATRTFNIMDIKKNKVYKIWGISVGDFGHSNKTAVISLSVQKIFPSAPLNLRGKLIGQNTITLEWDLPKTGTPSGGYKVHYGPDTNLLKVTIKVSGQSARLEYLQLDSAYEITVGAIGEDGEGELSNQIVVSTAKSTPSVTDMYSDSDSQKKTGLAVGLVLGLIFLLALAVLVLFMYRRYRASKNIARDTVAFENPQYGPKITGLPGESSDETNQFQYGHLNEETDVDHAYATPQNSIIGNPEGAATLNLEHQA